MVVEHAVSGIGGDGLRDELRRLLLPVFLVGEHPEEVQRVGVAGVRLQDLAINFLGFIEAARLVKLVRLAEGVRGGGAGGRRARLIPAGFLGFAGHGSSGFGRRGGFTGMPLRPEGFYGMAASF